MSVIHPQDDEFIESLGRFIDANAMLPGGAGVVLAVSGGADSVALLAAMNALADQPGREYRLIVAHLNHLIRPSAGDDATFVAELAKRLSLPCVIGQADVPALAEQLGQGVEQAGRMARYEFLLKAARDNAAGFVATGHHADDNVETILYRIFRGTALKGLAGMPLRRPLLEGRQTAAAQPVMLIRPMLQSRRDEIEAFCTRQGLPWQTDESNTDTTYRRNFIRHDLLDMLRQKLNPRVDEAILRLAQTAGEIDEYLTAQAGNVLDEATISSCDNPDNRAVELRAQTLADLPAALRTAAIRLAMERLGVPMRSLGFDRIADATAVALPDGPTCANLPGHCRIRRDGEKLIIEIAAANDDDSLNPSAEQIPLNCPGTTALPDGACIRCKIIPFDPATFDAHR
ncbi:MAG: tRNA lysidine(34) synthetase TilS, partial [Planctomycetaceae bacterium]